jgi:hypothetical protein
MSPMSADHPTHNLDARVRELLARMLRPAFDGVVELAAQIPTTRVHSGPVTMLRLDVDRSCAPSELPDGPIPNRGYVRGPSGEPTGQILVWVKGGYLSTFEFAWFTDQPPDQLPQPELVDVH